MNGKKVSLSAGALVGIIIAAVSVVTGAVIIVLFATGVIGGNKGPENDLLARVDQIRDIPENDRQAAMDQLVRDSEINVTYASEATFRGNVSEDFMVRNIEANHYPISFTIFDESGKEIYQSQPIPIGSEITAISLKEALPVGKHDCKIQIGYDGQGNVKTTFPLSVTVLEE